MSQRMVILKPIALSNPADFKYLVMKILAADDQKMILTAIKNNFKHTTYQLITAEDGVEAIDQFEKEQPDLLVLDINMPGKSGFDVIKYVRKVNGQVPIIVMTSCGEEETLAQAFRLGANDFIEKPVGINKLIFRVQKLLNQPINSVKDSEKAVSQTIDKHMVGVVIPCYNEALRIKKIEFFNYIDRYPSYHLCFVNDGSTDNTLEVLNKLAEDRPDNISVYDCPQNGGKAEAVRQGMLHLAKDKEFNFIGFLDADLSTDLSDFDGLVQTLSNSKFKMVNGSRIARMGADIHKDGARQIISKTINLIIRKILGMPFQDTQCGAKVMTPDLARIVFQQKFLTRWLFDVEIFMRLKKKFGQKEAVAMLCEQPLKRWVHEDGSKLSMKDSIKILGQLMQIAVSYR